jgi:hypothetical protein
MASHTGNSTRPLVGARPDVQEVSGQPPEGREAACEISLAIARRHVMATRFAGRFWVPVPKFPISRARHLNPNLDKSVFAKTP